MALYIYTVLGWATPPAAGARLHLDSCTAADWPTDYLPLRSTLILTQIEGKAGRISDITLAHLKTDFKRSRGCRLLVLSQSAIDHTGSRARSGAAGGVGSPEDASGAGAEPLLNHVLGEGPAQVVQQPAHVEQVLAPSGVSVAGQVGRLALACRTQPPLKPQLGLCLFRG